MWWLSLAIGPSGKPASMVIANVTGIDLAGFGPQHRRFKPRAVGHRIEHAELRAFAIAHKRRRRCAD